MSQFNEKLRPISELSDIELELLKPCYRQASLEAITRIAHSLKDLEKYGICVRRITNYSITNYHLLFARAITIVTGMPLVVEGKFPVNDEMNVAWDFYSQEVVQHVIEPELP
jgi:hypothetical protein